MTLFMTQLTTAVTTPLPLKELHLPDPVSWWPLAPGWWILTAFIIVISSASLFALRRWWKNNRDRREARYLLKSVYAQWQAGGQSQEYIFQVNCALKRFCRRRFPHAVSLTGESWIDFLNSTAGKTLFNEITATILAQGAYQPTLNHQQLPAEQILKASLCWLKKAKNKKSNVNCQEKY